MSEKETVVKEFLEEIGQECRDAGASDWDATKLLKRLAELTEIEGLSELRERAIEELKKINPKAADVYASFYRLKVFTSRQSIEPFDRGNIIRSLVKETDITLALAKKIGHEVEEKIKDLDLEHLSTPLIREMVNEKLLEFGHEKIRNQYARVGMPAFEVQKKLEAERITVVDLLAEYTLLRVLPSRLAQAHYAKRLVVSRIQDFPVKFFSQSLSLAEEDALEAQSRALAALQAASLGPSFFGLNFFFAKEKNREQEEGFFRALGNLSPLFPGATFTGHLLLYSPGGESLEERNTAVGTAKRFLGGEKSTFSWTLGLENPFEEKLLEKGEMRGSFSLLLGGGKRYAQGPSRFSATPFLLMEACLNLTLLALENRREEPFFEALGEMARGAVRLREIKERELRKRGFLKEWHAEAEKSESHLALDSLAGAVSVVGEGETRKGQVQLGEKIIRFLKERLGEPSWRITKVSEPDMAEGLAQHNQASHNRRPVEDSLESPYLLENFDRAWPAASRKSLERLLEKKAKLVQWKG